MMNTLPAILTTTALLIHSVFGCCWHHAHQCGADASVTSAAGAPSAAGPHHHTCGHNHSTDARSTGGPAHHHAIDLSADDAAQLPAAPCNAPHSGGEECDGEECLTIAVNPTDSRLQLEFGRGIVAEASAGLVQPGECHLARILCSATAEQRVLAPLRAQTQAWLL